MSASLENHADFAEDEDDSWRRHPTQLAYYRYLENGDPECMRSILTDLYPEALAYCRNRIGRGHDADDAAQEVMLGFTERLAINAQQQLDRPVRGLLYAIAANKTADTFRKWKRLSRQELHDEVPESVLPDSSDSEQESHMLQGELSQKLGEYILCLSEKQRHIITLSQLQGMRLVDIAKETGMTPVAVRVAKHRALAKLRLLITNPPVATEEVAQPKAKPQPRPSRTSRKQAMTQPKPALKLAEVSELSEQHFAGESLDRQQFVEAYIRMRLPIGDRPEATKSLISYLDGELEYDVALKACNLSRYMLHHYSSTLPEAVGLLQTCYERLGEIRDGSIKSTDQQMAYAAYISRAIHAQKAAELLGIREKQVKNKAGKLQIQFKQPLEIPNHIQRPAPVRYGWTN